MILTKRCLHQCGSSMWWTNINCINILDEERYLHQLAWWEYIILLINKLKWWKLLMSSSELLGGSASFCSSTNCSWCIHRFTWWEFIILLISHLAHQCFGYQILLDGIGIHPFTNTCKLRCFFPLLPLPVEMPFPVIDCLFFIGCDVNGIWERKWGYCICNEKCCEADPVVLCAVMSLYRVFYEVQQFVHQMNWWQTKL